MIAYEEALERVLAEARPLPAEWVGIVEASGRYLARVVFAREAIPRFDQSAMDGYGVRAADLCGASEARPVSLKVIGEVRAGDSAIRSKEAQTPTIKESWTPSGSDVSTDANPGFREYTPPGATEKLDPFRVKRTSVHASIEAQRTNAPPKINTTAKPPRSAKDCHEEEEIVHLRANSGFQSRLSQGEAVRIFTGAPIPPGVDAVVMQEVCERRGESVLFRKAVEAGANVRYRGEEFVKGVSVVAAGTRITPPVVGLLVTLGYERVMVHRRPRVALIATGNELVEPGARLRPGQIRDANSPALATALAGMNAEVISAMRVGDDRGAIRAALSGALAAADVVLTVGGVSVGDYDYVKDVAAEVGVKPLYWQVAIKPGMPNYLGMQIGGKRAGTRLVFGLPGNPVAALVSFHLFVRPALLKMAGASEAHAQPRCEMAILAKELRKRHKRLEWVRGALEAGEGGGLTVTPTGGQASHMLGGLAAANCLIEFPADSEMLARGETVRVMRLDWEGA